MRVAWLLVLTVVLLTAAACGDGNADDAGADFELVLPPPVELAVGGSCEDTSALEDWLEMAEFQIIALNNFLNIASDKSRSGLRADLEYLAGVRNNLAQTPAPDCTVDVQNEVIDLFDRTVASFVAYINRGEGNAGAIVRETRSDLEAIRPKLDALIAQMESQFSGNS